MSKKTPSQLEISQQKAEDALNRTNQRIEVLGEYDGFFYSVYTQLQDHFDAIRNVPDDKRTQLADIKKESLRWKQQVDKIQSDYDKAMTESKASGAAGVAGIGLATLGPTAAMGIATTFGVASTGTAISALSGAAATNAALAWLGGGALAAGGGGMAAGNALLALAGPIGWTIAGVAFVASGILFFKNREKKKTLDRIYTLIADRDTKSYELAIVEINERIGRLKEETLRLSNTLADIKIYGTDYNAMTEEQQYNLGAAVNLMKSALQLLILPIMGLQPKFTEADYRCYTNQDYRRKERLDNQKKVFISLCNLLAGVQITDDEGKTLMKSLKANKDFLKAHETDKAQVSEDVAHWVPEALTYHIQRVGIVGEAVNDGWDKDMALILTDSGNLWKGTFNLKPGEFKFRANNAWVINWGGTEECPTPVIQRRKMSIRVGGYNFIIKSPGKYDIELNPGNDEEGYLKVSAVK